MTSRRDFLYSVAAVAPASWALAAQAAHAAIGVPLKITKVEPFILRYPNDHKPEDQYIDMTPLGDMTGGIGLLNRLERAEPVRQKNHEQTCLVKVSTDQGVFGWGEAHAVTAPRVVKTIIEDLLAPVVMGQDARNIEAIWEKMYTTERLRGHKAGYWMRALAGIDIALYDIVGKAAGMPVYQLLGGKFRDGIPTYNGVGGRTPAAMKENVQRLLEMGYTTQKMSLAKGGRETRNVDLVVAASEVLKEKGQILVDSLGGYTLHEATIIGRQLDRLGNIGWWEDVLQPEDIDGFARLAETLDVPICAGEELSNRFDFRDYFKARAVDIINPDPCRIGITETKRITILADINNVLWSPHSSMGSAPYRAAALHLCVSTPNAVILEGGESYKGPLGNRLLKSPLDYKPGFAKVPTSPGLGVEFDEKELSGLFA